MNLKLMELKGKVAATVLALMGLALVMSGPKVIKENFLYTPWDRSAEKYVEEGLVKAGVAFGISKGINAAVSLAQDADVTFEPVGVGVSISPGQVLDPLNDMVERFSTVMLFSMTALGIQKILISLFPVLAWWIVIPLLLVVFVVGIWFSDGRERMMRELGGRMLIFVVLLRFFMPLEASFMAFLDEKCLHDVYESNISELQVAQEEITSLEGEDLSHEEPDGFWESLKEKLDVAGKIGSVSESVGSLVGMTENIFNRIVVLSAVFVLQTVLLPLGGALFFYIGGKRLLHLLGKEMV